MCIKTYRLATLTISFNHLLNYSVSIPSRLHHYPSDDVILKDAILEDAIILVTILEEKFVVIKMERYHIFLLQFLTRDMINFNA